MDQAMLDGITVGVTVHDLSGTIVASNVAADRLLGFGDRGLIGRSPFDVARQALSLDGSPLEGPDHPAASVLRTGQPVHGQVLGIRGRDERIVWLRVDVEPQHRNGGLTGVISTFTDITAERAHFRAYRTLSRGNMVVVRATDEVTLLRSMCETILTSGGYALAWVGVGVHNEHRDVAIVGSAGRTDYLIDGFVSWAEDDPRGQGPTGVTLRTGTLQYVEDMQVSAAYGPWRERALRFGFGSSMSIPMDFGDGRPAALMIYAPDPRAFDDTSVELLRELAIDLAYGVQRMRLVERVRATSESVPFAQFVVGPDRSLIDANATALELGVTGDANESWSSMLRDLLHDEAMAMASHPRWGALRAGVDREVTGADGTSIPVRVWAAPLTSTSTGPLGAVVTMQDLRPVRSLEDHVIQAQRFESVGFMASGVAHDVNNVLTVMLGLSGLLLDRDSTAAELREGMVRMRASAERVAGLAKRLLEIGRPATSSIGLAELAPAIDDALELVGQMPGAPVRIEVTHEQPDVTVQLEPVHLGQVVLNLLANAKQAMPAGGVIQVRTAVDQRGGLRPVAVIEIEDAGSGISPEVLDRIFEPFFTTKHDRQGTGMGLPVVASIVRRAGGSIQVESEPAGTTTFTVRLPVA